MKIVAVLMLVVLVAGIPAGAGATGTRIAVNGGDSSQGQAQQATTTRDNTFRDPRLAYPDPRTQYPDPRLRTRAAPVRHFDAALKQQIADMLETMYAAPGIGLAATQVDWHHQLIVIDVSEDKNEPQVFINPEILSRETGRAHV